MFNVDKVHEGAATELIPTDEILLGRNVLVKYTDKVFTEADRKRMMAAATLTDPTEILWKSRYEQDHFDYDGVVFKKVFSGILKYLAIGRLEDTIKVGTIEWEEY